jgi:hypothetical protein
MQRSNDAHQRVMASILRSLPVEAPKMLALIAQKDRAINDDARYSKLKRLWRS